MCKHLILVLLQLSFALKLESQVQMYVDSLENRIVFLKGQKNGANQSDTSLINTLGKLSKAYWGSKPQRALDLAMEMLKLAEDIGYKKGIADAYNNIGVVHWYQADYSPALEFLKKCLKLRLALGDKEGIASSYGNIGILYDVKGNDAEALENYYKSLKIFEELGDESGIAYAYGNIGIIYKKQGNFAEALKKYNAALKIHLTLGEKKDAGDSYINIGNLYIDQGNYEAGLKSNLAGLALKKEIGETYGISLSYNNIGVCCFRLNRFEEALHYYFESVKLKEEIGDKDGISGSYGGIGQVYTQLKKYELAETYLKKAVSLSKEVGSWEIIQKNLYLLAKLDSTQGNYAQAFELMKEYVLYRDSMVNSENTKKLTEQHLQYEFDKKEALLKAEQDKKDKINESIVLAHVNEKKLYIVLGVFLFLAVLALWNRLNFVRKTRKIVEEKNEQIRIEKEIAEQERAKTELMDMRNKIAKDLHDDIGSSLSSISIFSEIAHKITAEKAPDADKILNDISQIAHEALVNMNDIVWAINPLNDKLGDIMQRMKILSNQVKEMRNIDFHFEVPDEEKNNCLSMHQRKNVYLIFKEALNNMVKYSGAKNCYVKVEKNKGMLQISIKDDGVGFEKTPTQLGGNGLLNMKQRIEEMNGTLNITSALNKGTEVVFSFKV